MLSLDLTDPANVALAGYARRIGALLTETAVLTNTDLAGSLDDFLGAVYALIQAKQHGFTDRTAPIDITAVERRARMIAAGKVRLDGKWIAGGYFNNALFRTAAIYHRILKIVVGGKSLRACACYESAGALPAVGQPPPRPSPHPSQRLEAHAAAGFTIRGRSRMPLPLRPQASCSI